MSVRVLEGHVVDALAGLPERSVHVYTLVEHRPGWWLIFDDAGGARGHCPTLRGARGVADGLAVDVADFSFTDAVAVVRRWLEGSAG